jgi:hypothetical protein
MVTKMQLYKITNEMLELQNSGMSPEDIADTIDCMELEFGDKIEQTLSLIKNMEAEAIAFKVEAKRLSDIASIKLKSVDKVKEYIKGEMARLGKEKFSTGVHSLTVRKPVKKLNIVNDKKIPPKWFDVKVTQAPKKKEILAALKDGQDIEGVEIVMGESSLIIN